MTKHSGVAVVMLMVMGVFQLLAALATFIPSFVHDRVTYQFTPVWTFVLETILHRPPNADAAHTTMRGVGPRWIRIR